MNNNKSVLISGASIAGPALAYWLRRHGFNPTVVERAPAVRAGGQAVDFRGEAHVTMLRRMGIWEDVRGMDTGMRGLHVVDTTGRRVVSLPASLTAGDVEIHRGDLSHLLYERTRDTTEYVFGDSIASLAETGAGVEVTFERGTPRTFDLVVGADGLHSHVRRLTFGPESQFVKQSGYYVALFSGPNVLSLNHEGLLFNEPARGLMVTSTRDATTANVMCIFAADRLDFDYRNVAQQKEIVAGAYAGVGGEAPRLMRAMPDAADFYFDSISLVRMEQYTQGRVALLGDAGYGATFGGMGAGMAMISAYLLAGELAAAGGDHRAAFARYQEQIRPYAKACQRVAGGAGPFLAPATERKIRRRNRMYRLLSSRLLGGVLNRMTTKAANSITLKEYQV